VVKKNKYNHKIYIFGGSNAYEDSCYSNITIFSINDYKWFTLHFLELTGIYALLDEEENLFEEIIDMLGGN